MQFRQAILPPELLKHFQDDSETEADQQREITSGAPKGNGKNSNSANIAVTFTLDPLANSKGKVGSKRTNYGSNQKR